MLACQRQFKPPTEGHADEAAFPGRRLLLTACAAAAQTADGANGGAIMVSAEQVEQIRQNARAAQAPNAPALSRPIIAAPPYALNLEHRTGKAPASVHAAEAEVIIVLDGAGTITTGGTLVNAAHRPPTANVGQRILRAARPSMW